MIEISAWGLLGMLVGVSLLGFGLGVRIGAAYMKQIAMRIMDEELDVLKKEIKDSSL